MRDLLPLYIDNLTSDESRKLINEHLKNCNECSELLSNLSKPIIADSSEIVKEIDYLKKVKHKKRIAIFITAGICLVIFLVVSFVGFRVLVVGSPISPHTMEYRYDYNEQTRELTITGSFQLSQTELSGIKVEEDKRLLNTINITVYGAERYSSTKEYNKEFTKTIKIPDNGAAWSVHLLGESPHEAVEVWTNYYDMEDSAKDTLTKYLTKNEGFLPNKDILLMNPEAETTLPVVDGFIWEFHKNDVNSEKSTLNSIWAVSTDSSKIFVYDKASDSWVGKINVNQ